MKTKFITTLILSLLILPAFSQNAGDALRFSQNFSGGTARSLSMGGAFGALGGDPSSLSINPAGLGIYRASEFTLTMGVNADNTDASYNNYKSNDYNNKFNLSNIAFIFNSSSDRNNGWVSASFGIAYNKLNDFNRNYFIYAQNQQSSLLDNFTSVANYNYVNGQYVLEPYYPQYLNGYYEGPAFDSYLIDTIAGTGEYVNVINQNGYGQTMKKLISTKGGLGEWDFSFGANISNKFYFGATLGVQRLNYEEIKSHREIADGADLNGFDNFNFTEHFNAYGNGVNLKVGFIAKPVEFLRLGLALHTPTYFVLNSEFYTSMSSRMNSESEDYFITTDIYSNEYKLKTPMKAIGSLALVFPNIGIFSVDYEHVNYAKASFKVSDPSGSSTDDFTSVNSDISNFFQQTSNLKFGFEGKLGPIAGRLGYNVYGNPYTDGQINADYKYQSYSAGIGYRGKSFFFDVAYVVSQNNEKQLLYEYITNNSGTLGYTQEIADIKITTTKIMATIGFRF